MVKNEVGTEIPKHIEIEAVELGLNLIYIYEDGSYGDKCPASNPGVGRPSKRFQIMSSANNQKVYINNNYNWVFFKSPTYGFSSTKKGISPPKNLSEDMSPEITGQSLKPINDGEYENKIKHAKNYEKALRFEDAAKLYEELGLWDDAGRVRKLAKEQQAPQMKVDIGEIDRSTHISDSVLHKSPIGVSEKPLNNCPFCGESFSFKKTPKFCPYCNEELG